MSITLTERAAKHISGFLTKRGKGVGLRLGVRTSGCSGLAYKIEFADAVNPEDVLFETNGVKVLVDPKSLPYLDGTERARLRARRAERRLQVQQSEHQGPVRLRRVLQRLIASGGKRRLNFRAMKRTLRAAYRAVG